MNDQTSCEARVEACSRVDGRPERQTLEAGPHDRRANREQRATMRRHVEQLVPKHFEGRQARRRLQLKRLEEEVQRMQEAL